MRRWLSARPTEPVRDRPRLCLAQAFGAAQGFRVEALQALLDDAERALAVSGEEPYADRRAAGECAGQRPRRRSRSCAPRSRGCAARQPAASYNQQALASQPHAQGPQPMRPIPPRHPSPADAHPGTRITHRDARRPGIPSRQARARTASRATPDQNRRICTRRGRNASQKPSRPESAVCNCLSWLRYARLSRYVTGERCYSSSRGSSCPPLGVTAGDRPFRDAASASLAMQDPGPLRLVAVRARHRRAGWRSAPRRGGRRRRGRRWAGRCRRRPPG